MGGGNEREGGLEGEGEGGLEYVCPPYQECNNYML